jgi:DNA-binding NarL/FixJ family response regulator
LLSTNGPILLADADRGSRTKMADLLGRIGFATEQVRTGPEALEAAARVRPALVLLEINLPEVSGYEVCRELRDLFGDDVAIIFLSVDRTEPYDRVAGLLLGADDYIVKPFDDGEFLARVRNALRHARSSSTLSSHESGDEDALTSREGEVLGLLARGLDQGDIARKLFISPKTVGTHIQRVLTKLGVHSRAQAVAVAHERGLTELDGGFLEDEPSPSRHVPKL